MQKLGSLLQKEWLPQQRRSSCPPTHRHLSLLPQHTSGSAGGHLLLHLHCPSMEPTPLPPRKLTWPHSGPSGDSHKGLPERPSVHVKELVCFLGCPNHRAWESFDCTPNMSLAGAFARASSSAGTCNSRELLAEWWEAAAPDSRPTARSATPMIMNPTVTPIPAKK
jgi:hypothetical protein